jgi:3-oxoacyl-[acyl-carrier protein] reductase
MKLLGKSAIIVGGAQGIGKATAQLFLQEGAKVVIADLDADLAENTAKELGESLASSNFLVEVASFGGNVTNLQHMEQLTQATIQKFGKIDIVVNSAGITKDNLLLRMSEMEWDAVMGVNLKGAFNLTKAVLKPMLKARSGRIINISSVVGITGNAGQTNYSASKGGLISFTKSCAKELASRNILVNCVAPGFVRTRMTDVLPEDVKEKVRATIPLGRFGEPEDIAKVLLFLASDDASYITGQVISVNGGMYM